MTDSPCRCGYKPGDPFHPCHHGGYTCKKPGVERYVPLGLAALPGMQMKMSVYQTWACDQHWAEYRRDRAPAVQVGDG